MTGKLLGVAQELISSRERVAPAESKPRPNTAPEVVSRQERGCRLRWHVGMD